MSDDKLFGGESVLSFRLESDRRNFLRWAGAVGVGASLVAGGIAEAPLASAAGRVDSAASEDGDLGILNYALTLEYLESDFYTKGVKQGVVSGRELSLVRPIRDHEDAHVQALLATIKKLGGTPVDKPGIKYPSGTFGSRTSFLTTAATFEEVGVTAYHGQVPLIKSGVILGAAASIAGVESRHAAVIHTLIETNPFPAPIEKHRTKSEVLAIVKPFLA